MTFALPLQLIPSDTCPLTVGDSNTNSSRKSRKRVSGQPLSHSTLYCLGVKTLLGVNVVMPLSFCEHAQHISHVQIGLMWTSCTSLGCISMIKAEQSIRQPLLPQEVISSNPKKIPQCLLWFFLPQHSQPDIGREGAVCYLRSGNKSKDV